MAHTPGVFLCKVAARLAYCPTASQAIRVLPEDMDAGAPPSSCSLGWNCPGLDGIVRIADWCLIKLNSWEMLLPLHLQFNPVNRGSQLQNERQDPNPNQRKRWHA